MSRPPTARWLRVALRASEFRVLLGAGELAQATVKAEQANAALGASRDATAQGQALWRTQRALACFHADDDSRARQFQWSLAVNEAHCEAVVQKAADQFAGVQQALVQEMAEKQALQAALERAREHHQVLLTQQAQRESDEAWRLRPGEAG